MVVDSNDARRQNNHHHSLTASNSNSQKYFAYATNLAAVVRRSTLGYVG